MSCTVALANDLREVDVSQIKDVKIFFTMMDGRFTYRANAR